MEITLEEDVILMEAKEIFKYLDKALYNKIPENIRSLIEEYQGKHEFTYDTTKTLNEQNISQKTKDLIVYFYYVYCADEEGRNKVEENCKKTELLLEKKEKELREKYSYDNLFTKNERITNKTETVKEEIKNTELIIVKESFVKKIINKIKLFFYKKG